MSAITRSRSPFCCIAGFLLLFATIPQLIHAQQRAVIESYPDASDFLKQGFIPLVLRQRIDDNQYAGVDASSNCRECEQYGIRQHLVRVDDLRWKLMMEVVDTVTVRACYAL
jgi:hypothetical protein